MQVYAREQAGEWCESLKKRNKHIHIADTSEDGCDTVRMYEANPLASDLEDESRINRAESRIMKRRENICKILKSTLCSATATSDSQRSFKDSFPRQQQQQLP